MCTSNYHFEWKFGVLLFCDAKICSTISGKLLRFLGISFFIPFKFPECIIISKFYQFIYKFRENRLQFICWMNLIYVIQNVFLQKNAVWVVLISTLEPQITCLLCHSLGLFCKIQLHWPGHPWKIKKSENLILGLYREIEERHQIDQTAHSGNIPDCIGFIHEAQFDCLLWRGPIHR